MHDVVGSYFYIMQLAVRPWPRFSTCPDISMAAGFQSVAFHAAVRPFRHDLYRAAGHAGNANPNKAIAHSGKDRFGNRSDTLGAPRLDNKPWFRGECRQFVVHSVAASCKSALALR